MLLAWLSLLSLGHGLNLLFGEDGRRALDGLRRREERALDRAVGVFAELEQTLEAGIVPDDARWGRIEALAPPWGRVAAPCLKELREAGGALLPTLRRLRAAAAHHRATLHEARARAAQALAQAGICAALGPLAGGAYYLLVPGLDRRPELWAAVCAAGLLMSAAAGFWMVRLAEDAQWAGLPVARRGWGVAAHAAAERLLAGLRAGVPADLAWGRAVGQLRAESPELAACWGESVWQAAPGELDGTRERLHGTAALLADFGHGLRGAVHASLLEGRPVSERLESALAANRAELAAAVERELALLGTRALKPLFLLIAPAMAGLLLAAFALSSVAEGVG